MEKEISVVNLNQKPISFTDKQTGQPKTFVVYQIMGNDGVTYETNDAKMFATFAVGQQAKVKYVVQSRQSGGKIYTSYKLVSPFAKKFGADNTEVLEALRKVYQKLEAVEKNLLAAIDLKEVALVDDVEIPVINEELSVIKEAEVEQGNSDGMPF